MEAKADYVTRAVVKTLEHRCDNCQKIYGFETAEGYLNSDGVWLKDIEIIRAKCGGCGATVKWYSTNQRMERMLRGRKRKQ